MCIIDVSTAISRTPVLQIHGNGKAGLTVNAESINGRFLSCSQPETSPFRNLLLRLPSPSSSAEHNKHTEYSGCVVGTLHQMQPAAMSSQLFCTCSCCFFSVSFLHGRAIQVRFLGFHTGHTKIHSGMNRQSRSLINWASSEE